MNRPLRSLWIVTLGVFSAGVPFVMHSAATPSDSYKLIKKIPIPGEGPLRYGLCDGLHRDDHELIPA